MFGEIMGLEIDGKGGRDWLLSKQLRLLITLTLKRANRTSDYKPNAYTSSISKKIVICPKGITYNPCPETSGGGVSSSEP